jgi:hypothetical protein
MADEGLMVFPGMVMDKSTAIATIRQVAPWVCVRRDGRWLLLLHQQSPG